MKTLTKIAALAAGAAATLTAATASAQPYDHRGDYRGGGYERDRGYDGYGRGGRGEVSALRAEFERLQARIDRGERRGRLDRRELHLLDASVRSTDHRFQMYAVDGFTRWEIRDLRRRIYDLDARLRNDLADGRYADGRRWR